MPTDRVDRSAPPVILYAEDDPDDRVLMRDAVRESDLEADLRFVEDGTELLAYLRRQGEFADSERSPRPAIVLIDLNMPRKGGREVLSEMKRDSNLRSIPVVVLTTSSAEADIFQSYDTGASSYITKPVTFDGLVAVVRQIRDYWLETVQLPMAVA